MVIRNTLYTNGTHRRCLIRGRPTRLHACTQTTDQQRWTQFMLFAALKKIFRTACSRERPNPLARAPEMVILRLTATPRDVWEQYFDTGTLPKKNGNARFDQDPRIAKINDHCRRKLQCVTTSKTGRSDPTLDSSRNTRSTISNHVWPFEFVKSSSLLRTAERSPHSDRIIDPEARITACWLMRAHSSETISISQ